MTYQLFSISKEKLREKVPPEEEKDGKTTGTLVRRFLWKSCGHVQERGRAGWRRQNRLDDTCGRSWQLDGGQPARTALWCHGGPRCDRTDEVGRADRPRGSVPRTALSMRLAAVVLILANLVKVNTVVTALLNNANNVTLRRSQHGGLRQPKHG